MYKQYRRAGTGRRKAGVEFPRAAGRADRFHSKAGGTVQLTNVHAAPDLR